MTCLSPEQHLGSGEQRPSPPISLALASSGIDKIFGYNQSRHLKMSDESVEPAAHLRLSETACCPQFASDEAAVLLEGFKHHSLHAVGFKLPQPAAAPIAEVGPQRLADKARLAVEKLAVGTAALPNHIAFPLPQIPFPAAIGQLGVLAILVDLFLSRPPRNAHAQQRQKADAVDKLNKLRTAVQIMQF